MARNLAASLSDLASRFMVDDVAPGYASWERGLGD